MLVVKHAAVQRVVSANATQGSIATHSLVGFLISLRVVNAPSSPIAPSRCLGRPDSHSASTLEAFSGLQRTVPIACFVVLITDPEKWRSVFLKAER